ncbi:response regulator transcription factor [Neobacillus sp. DY30]|uniref:response regulator transcription factor n=1 Tax=Neobacillus sp. DY30 TaxID=3047871 RepID=UPI0024BF2F45|nr:response regulator transcription factor [Neobacillus sp. DY30]WHY02661.1 response regulator transcription factor [Neobacillus sp. DY30]
MKKPLILIADDEIRLAKLVTDFLVNSGFGVLTATDGMQAFNLFNEYRSKIDLIILDVMMPQMDGWEVLKEIKSISCVPIIMLTAKAEEPDQLTGFKLGANDYVTKPFSPSVLVARVENLLKRSGKVGGERLLSGNLSIDLIEHNAYIDNTVIELTPKEFDLLVYFIQNDGIALSRDNILNAVWNHDYFGDLRTVDTHVKQLRAKLGLFSCYIQTVRGIGYRMRCQHEDLDKS